MPCTACCVQWHAEPRAFTANATLALSLFPSQSLVYKPDEDEVAKARRAKKFGSTYQPVEGAMMDMGGWGNVGR